MSCGSSSTLTVDDRLALRELADRYAACVDERRFDALTELFAVDGVLVGPATPEPLGPTVEHHGREEIAASMSALVRVPVTLHAVVGQTLAAGARPGVATGRVACVAHHVTRRHDGRLRDSAWHLHYLDDYRREPRDWVFARRELRVDWIEGREVELCRG